MAEIDQILARMLPMAGSFAGNLPSVPSFRPNMRGPVDRDTPSLPYFSGLDAQYGPARSPFGAAQPSRLPSQFSNPLSTGSVDMNSMREYLQNLQAPQQKPQGQLPQGSYTKTGSTLSGPYNQQIFPKASDAGFGDTTALANILQQPRYGRDSAPEPGPGMGGVRQDTLQSTKETKGGGLSKQTQEKPTGASGFITPEMRPILASMVKRDPSLMKDPRRMGAIITKLMPFMHKIQQEKYAQAKQEHTQRMETLTQERAARAERLEEYKTWLDRVKYQHEQAKDAWSRLKDVQDPLKEFAGDRKDLIERYTSEYEAAEAERKRLQAENPYTQKANRGGEAEAGAPNKASTLDEKAHAALSTQYEKGIDKAKAALTNAKSLDERNLILHNTLKYVGAARTQAGMPELTAEEKKDFVQSMPSHDTRTWGEQAGDWLGHKAEEYFPTAYQLYKDLNSFPSSPWDDPLSPSRILSGLNPLTAESQYAHGIRKARGMEPSAEQLSRRESNSIPERIMGGLNAIGGVAGPMLTAADPLATTAATGFGSSVEQATDSPYAGLAATLLAGGGLGRAQQSFRPPAPQGPHQLGAPPQYPGLPKPGLPYEPTPPNPHYMNPAPAGTPRLPPPGNFPPSAGGRGQPAYRPAFEMPDPSLRMGAPAEQRLLPPPTPRDPVSQAEAAAEIAAGKEPAAPVEAPRKPLQATGGPFGVNQFGEHTVGDTVKFNGRTRKIEELIPARPGHLAPKARLSGLKLPVTLTKLEPVSAKAARGFTEGDRVQWDLPAGFGSASGVVKKITTSPRGNAMATVQRSDGKLVDVDVTSLKNV